MTYAEYVFVCDCINPLPPVYSLRMRSLHNNTITILQIVSRPECCEAKEISYFKTPRNWLRRALSCSYKRILAIRG